MNIIPFFDEAKQRWCLDLPGFAMSFNDVGAADQLAAAVNAVLEADRAKGEVRWLFTSKDGIENIFRYPVFFVGGTVRKVRVVEVEET